MPSQLQELASARNWNKARIMGLTINEKALTNIEKGIFYDILKLKKQLLDSWDKNTPLLGLKTKKICH